MLEEADVSSLLYGWQCVKKLTSVQQLMERDVKVNRPLVIACRKAMKENECLKNKDGLKLRTHEARQSMIVLCLENAMDDKESE